MENDEKKKYFKKCLSFICIIVSCISLIACANNPEINTAENETAKGEQTKENKKDNKRKYEKQESVLEPIIQEAESDPTNNESFLTQLEKFKNRQSEYGIDDENIILSSDMIPVMDTIDRYFQALNNMDADTINEIAPIIADHNEYHANIDSTNIMQRYVGDSSFKPLGLQQFHEDFPDCFKSFGYDSEEDYYSAIKNNQLDDLFKDFYVTYELHAIKPVEDCAACGYRHGIENVGMNDYNPIKQYDAIEKEVEEKPSQVYMINLTTVYAYGNKLYGFDEEWWNMDNSPSNNPYNHWIIQKYVNFTTDIRVYNYNDKWYIDSSSNWNLANGGGILVDYHDPDEEVKKQYYEGLESEE